MNEDYMDSIGKFESNSRRDMEDSKTAPLSQGVIFIVDNIMQKVSGCNLSVLVYYILNKAARKNSGGMRTQWLKRNGVMRFARDTIIWLI